VLIPLLLPSVCRQGFLTKSSSVRNACHDRGSDRPSSNPNALLVVSTSGPSVGCARTRQFHKVRSSRAAMERRCGGGRLVREIQYKNTSHSSRSRICMHATAQKYPSPALSYGSFCLSSFFFQRCLFSFLFFFLSRSRSLFHPSLRGRGGWRGGVGCAGLVSKRLSKMTSETDEIL